MELMRLRLPSSVSVETNFDAVKTDGQVFVAPLILSLWWKMLLSTALVPLRGVSFAYEWTMIPPSASWSLSAKTAIIPRRQKTKVLAASA